jgi:Peptidase family M1 domain
MRLLFFAMLLSSSVLAQDIRNNPNSNHGNKFEQLGTILATPNEYRTASGAPGPKYWQQRVDYDIKCELDETTQKLTGSEKITYINNSPDVLTYLWLQLDENEHSTQNNSGYQSSSSMSKAQTDVGLKRYDKTGEDKHGDKIVKITDEAGKALPYTINKTMMRVDLPKALKPGQSFSFKVDWFYFLNNRMAGGGRGGYEFFPEDGNYLFTMAQWYPRLCVYSDFQGWQNHQFTGRGEFALTFGNYKVQMTVPSDHAVGSTGECQNYEQVLPQKVLERWKKVQTAKDVNELVTLDEAKQKEKTKATTKKTWIFNATNVRDFAWTSSRKYIWDAMPITVEGKKVMCMSFYPRESYGLYRKYSTKTVAHTIKTYSKFTIPYPYPVAQSVEAANGMEYPMICFNFGRTEKDGTYSDGTKYGMLGVVIHEVGHNFFPMIINSDERQWSWMDEGLNTFVEYLSEELFQNDFPSRRGPAFTIADYMKLPKDQLEPIMTNSENIVQFGPNAYSKPATGLNILRETIMGRELFDYSFKEYARRWAFKHPTPADFFRTMEDASAEDLDWFWRGWFYGIEPVDISLDTVKAFKLDVDDAGKPTGGNARAATSFVQRNTNKPFDDISKIRNRQDPKIKFAVDEDKSLVDAYTNYKPWETADSVITVNVPAAPAGPVTRDTMTRAEREVYAQNTFFYEISCSNKGGLVMPVIVEWTFKDGSKEIDRIPVQIWRLNENKFTKLFMKNKEVVSVKLDPMRETADINEKNNSWPAFAEVSKFQLFKQKQNEGRGRGAATGSENLLQREAKKNGVELKPIW